MRLLFAALISLFFVAAVVAAEPIKDLQTLLSERSCDIGAPDGAWGARTARAAETFAKAAGIAIARPVTDQLVAQLKLTTATCPQSLTLSRFIPSDVLAPMNALPDDVRARACEANLDTRLQLADLEPEKELRGLSSQMTSTKDLLGTLDAFGHHISAVMTSAYVRNSHADKDLLMAVLGKWAKAKAYEKTYDCSELKGKACEEWTSQRGLELSSLKDYQTVEERLIPVVLAYNLVLRDYKRAEMADEHKVIEDWLDFFVKRMPNTGRSTSSRIFLGFGMNWQTWGYPANDLRKGDEKSFKARLDNLAAKLNPLIAKDGSIPARTERGARALTYHQGGIEEFMIALEMAKANGLDLYPKYRDRLEKAVGIFLDGVEDVQSGRNTMDNPARIFEWAQADFHSAADPHVQIWNTDELRALGQNGSWVFSYLYRFPDSPQAPRLRALIASYDHLPMADMTPGLNFGCIYRLAIPELVERETSERPALSETKIATITETVGKPKVEAVVKLAYDSASFTPTGGDKNGLQFQIGLEGVKLDGTYRGSITFGILVDFKKPGPDIADLQLVRMTIDYDILGDKATSKSDLRSCSALGASDYNIRLHFGNEANENACVLGSLGPSDKALWSSVYANLPAIVDAGAASGDDAATTLKPFLDKKVAEAK